MVFIGLVVLGKWLDNSFSVCKSNEGVVIIDVCFANQIFADIMLLFLQYINYYESRVCKLVDALNF